MQSLLNPKYTSLTTQSRLKKFSCVGEMADYIFEAYKDKIALIDSGVEYTYAELSKKVGAIRFALSELGIKVGDKVGVFYPNSADFVIASMAVSSYGAVVVALPYHLDEKTLYGSTLKFQMSAIIYDSASGERVALAHKLNPNLKAVISDSIGEGFAPANMVEPDAPCAIVFTAGTTGQSKGALLSHKAILAGTVNGCMGFGDHDIFNDRYFLVLPLTHIFGYVRNMMTSLYTGSSLYICRDTKNMFREIPAYNPTIMIMVPALAEMALGLTRVMGTKILGNALKIIVAGAAVVAPHLAKEYDKLGVILLAGYGLTESANLVSGNPTTLANPTSVGFLYPNQEYKVVNGELWIKGDNVLTEYYNDPEETAKAFEDGFFKTGDLVKFDDNGYMYIVGRIKDIIVLSSGENIAPEELESKFRELECVRDCLIYKGTNDNGVEALIFEMTPRADVLKAKGIENIGEYCIQKVTEVNNTLLNYQKVSKIIIRTEDFERTPSMKIKRPKNIL
ncbi:MAG: acyl--CoA ligase [Ruminococcaceae bacterium]|nr:acyl--CoA ligase [Oscillospiraceae bacterium]